MPPPPATDPNKPPSNSFLRYSGFAFQLLGGLGLTAWLGHLLDSYLEFSFPVFMLTFLFGTLAGMLYQMNRKFNEEK